MTSSKLAKSLVALARKWRSEGEFWTGTPEDARSQHCADDLMAVLGENGKKVEANLRAEDGDALLKENGVGGSPIDTKIKWDAYIRFTRKYSKKVVSLIIKELKSGERPADIVIREKLGWAYEFGYEDGIRGRSKLIENGEGNGNKRNRSGRKVGKR